MIGVITEGNEMIKKNGFFLIILLILSFNLIPVDALEKDPIIIDVEKSLNRAFEKISSAENQGAQTKELVDTLNSAYHLYQEIISELENGNIIDANRKAQQCISIAEEVESDAEHSLTLATEQSKAKMQRLTFTRRIGAIAVVALGYFLWGPFERSYKNRILLKKPVISDES
jgi:hypothetical protein